MGCSRVGDRFLCQTRISTNFPRVLFSRGLTEMRVGKGLGALFFARSNIFAQSPAKSRICARPFFEGSNNFAESPAKSRIFQRAFFGVACLLFSPGRPPACHLFRACLFRVAYHFRLVAREKSNFQVTFFGATCPFSPGRPPVRLQPFFAWLTIFAWPPASSLFEARLFRVA